MSNETWKKRLQRLFNIDVREVSLVDKPAIDEPFTEVKRKDGQGTKQEEKVMDEEQVKEAIQSALAPLADGIKAIETRLEAQEKAVEESGKKMDELIAKGDEGSKSASESVEGMKKELEQVVEDSIKRFERIEGLVTKASSQKIAGQGDGEGKSQVKWPSLVGRKA